MKDIELAEQFAINGYALGCTKTPFESAKEGFLAGYNKANEWHDLKKNPEDLPKDRELYFVIIETDDGLKEPDVSFLGTDKRWACEDYSIRVIAWKEAVLPKESE